MQSQDHSLIELQNGQELLLLAKKGHFHNGNFGAPNMRRFLQNKELVSKEKEIYGLVIKETNMARVM